MEATRPRGLTETVWALLFVNLVAAYSAIANNWHGRHAVLFLLVAPLMMLAHCIVIWFYWTGHNWARILVLLVSVAALWNLTLWAQLSTFYRLIVVAPKAVLGLFLLGWLNTRPLKNYFIPRAATQL